MHGYALNHTALAAHRMHAPGALPHLALADAARAMTDHGLTMNEEGGVLWVMPIAYTTGMHWGPRVIVRRKSHKLLYKQLACVVNVVACPSMLVYESAAAAATHPLLLRQACSR
jgi:hypothetical protein